MRLKAKQEKIAQARREKEFHDLEDHTFQPHINGGEPVLNPNAHVKGLGRHLELVELQK